jgi:hypothetical protein
MVPFHLFLPRLLGYYAGLMMRLAMLAAFWVMVTAGRDRARYVVTLAVTYGILLFLSYYLLSTSRLPERVACCFPILTLAICLYWATARRRGLESTVGPSHESLRTKPQPAYWIWARVVLVGVTVAWTAWLLGGQARTLWMVSRWNQELKEVNRVIFSPVRALLPDGQKPVLVAMPYDSELERCLIFHSSPKEVPFILVPYGWLSQSPLFRRLLEECRLKPFATSLLNRPDVFFLMEKRWIERLRVTYREHYDQEVEFVRVFDSDTQPAYRDCRLQLYQARVLHTAAANRTEP